MRELTPKQKMEIVMICRGEKWSQFCIRNNLHYTRANEELSSGNLSRSTEEKIRNAVGCDIRTGFELIDQADTLKKKILIALKVNGDKELKWLANEMKVSPTYLSQKLRNESFSREDWKKLGDILGVKADFCLFIDDMII